MPVPLFTIMEAVDKHIYMSTGENMLKINNDSASGNDSRWGLSETWYRLSGGFSVFHVSHVRFCLPADEPRPTDEYMGVYASIFCSYKCTCLSIEKCRVKIAYYVGGA